MLCLSLRTEHDISLHLSEKLEDVADFDNLPMDCGLGEITVRLVRGADGMFLWARLIVSYVSPPALTL